MVVCLNFISRMRGLVVRSELDLKIVVRCLRRSIEHSGGTLTYKCANFLRKIEYVINTVTRKY